MCGIVGYVGNELRDIASVLLVGLERLSYRGYDSAGIATIYKSELSFWKKAGKIHELANALKNMSIQGTVGIGHTRWATHGEPNEVNAHPHLSQRGKKVAIVHNGIIENYTTLKKQLEKDGCIFLSQSDTEVIVHAIEKHLNGNLLHAVQKAITELTGSYAIAVISESEPDKIVACRKGSPLIIGVGKNENYISSDINALLPHTKDIMYLEDDEMAILTKESVQVYTRTGKPVQKEIHHISWDATATEKQGYPHYMLKEIFEQPSIVRNITSKYLDNSGIYFKSLGKSQKDLKKISRFMIQACGTSWHAGLIAKYLFEKYARVPTEVDISSEFRYRHMIPGDREIVVALSQSGETADTLACIREAKSKFFKVYSFVNVKGSSIDRESDAVIYTHAGPEIGVASTKNYIGQLVCLYLFAVYLGQINNRLPESEAKALITQLKRLPDAIESILQQADTIKSIAKKYTFSKQFIFIGRGVNFPTALEGALKLKEISYIHATGYPAGELKHGPIALIDSQLPVVCIAPKASTYEKMRANIEEVKARKGKTIIIATEGDTELKNLADDIIYIPECAEDLSPILTVIPLQLLAYTIALELDCDVDQPRNLAKSVTVE